MRRNPRRKRSKDDPKQLLLSLVVVVAFFSIWQQLFPPPIPVVPLQTSEQEGNHQLSDLSVEKIVSQVAAPNVAPSQTIDLKPSTPLYTLSDEGRFETVLNSHGQLDSWSIIESQYRHRISETESIPYLLTNSSPKFTKKGELDAPFLAPLTEIRLNNEAIRGEYTLLPGATASKATFALKNAQVQILKHFELIPGEYRVRSNIEVQNLSKTRAHIEIRGITRALQDANTSEAGMFTPPLNLLESICAYGEDFARDGVSSVQSKLEDHDPMSFSGARWFGVDSRYFMTSISVDQPVACTQNTNAKSLRLTTSIPVGFTPLSTEAILYSDFVDGQAQVKRSLTIYGGPKKMELLTASEPSLSEAIDFGIFSPICYLMLWALGFFYTWLPNWGIAIILLTLLVKLITLPLTIKQYRSMAAMKKIQPELQQLKEKYGKDAMRMQQETMALYKKHGANPLSGCLPMVVMMPIYFALYRTIYSAVELYQAHFFAWLNDLSMPDPFYITPIVLAGLMFLQAQMQPSNSAMDATQRRMLTTFMPLMFGAMMLFLPSGLVLYILVNTSLGIVQQQWSQRAMEAKG